MSIDNLVLSELKAIKTELERIRLCLAEGGLVPLSDDPDDDDDDLELSARERELLEYPEE